MSGCDDVCEALDETDLFYLLTGQSNSRKSGTIASAYPFRTMTTMTNVNRQQAPRSLALNIQIAPWIFAPISASAASAS